MTFTTQAFSGVKFRVRCHFKRQDFVIKQFASTTKRESQSNFQDMDPKFFNLGEGSLQQKQERLTQFQHMLIYDHKQLKLFQDQCNKIKQARSNRRQVTAEGEEEVEGIDFVNSNIELCR